MWQGKIDKGPRPCGANTLRSEGGKRTDNKQINKEKICQMVLNTMEENRAGRFRGVNNGGFYSRWPELASWER